MGAGKGNAKRVSNVVSPYAHLTYSVHVRPMGQRNGFYSYELAVTADQVGRSWDYFEEGPETEDLQNRLKTIGIDAEYDGYDHFTLDTNLDEASLKQSLGSVAGISIRPDRNITWEFGFGENEPDEAVIFVFPTDKVKYQDILDSEEEDILTKDLTALGLTGISADMECVYSFDWNGTEALLKQLLTSSGKFTHDPQYDIQ